MRLSVMQLGLTLGQPFLQGLIVQTMIKRGLRKQFPIFFNYTIFAILTSAIGLLVLYKGTDEQYFYSYWSLTGCGILFAFGALCEVLYGMLKPYSALRDLGKLLLWWIAVFLILTAVVTALATTGGEVGGICAAILMLQRVLRLMECGILLLIVTFQTRLGLSWRSHGISITLGLGIFGAVDLAVSYVLPRFPEWAISLSNAHALALDCVVATWAVNFLLPQPTRNTLSDSPTRLIFQRWNDVLAVMPHASGKAQAGGITVVESFLPGVERTVERVMARKMTH